MTPDMATHRRIDEPARERMLLQLARTTASRSGPSAISTGRNVTGSLSRQTSSPRPAAGRSRVQPPSRSGGRDTALSVRRNPRSMDRVRPRRRPTSTRGHCRSRWRGTPRGLPGPAAAGRGRAPGTRHRPSRGSIPTGPGTTAERPPPVACRGDDGRSEGRRGRRPMADATSNDEAASRGGPLRRRGRDTGGKRILLDPWRRTRGRRAARRPWTSSTCCWSRTATRPLPQRADIARRTKPAWPCVHELSLQLDNDLADGEAEVIGMNKGGTVETNGLKITMVGADHSAGDLFRGAERAALPRRAGRLHRRARERSAHLPLRRHAGHRRHGSDRGAVQARPGVPADRRPLHDGPTRSRPGDGAPRGSHRGAAPLRHLPDPHRDAGPAAQRAQRPRLHAVVIAPEPGAETPLP